MREPAVVLESDNLICVRKLTATDAARRFSELLDAVEQRGESFLVERHGRAVARIGPARAADGKAVKELLNATAHDQGWETELRDLRASLGVQERPWSG